MDTTGKRKSNTSDTETVEKRCKVEDNMAGSQAAGEGVSDQLQNDHMDRGVGVDVDKFDNRQLLQAMTLLMDNRWQEVVSKMSDMNNEIKGTFCTQIDNLEQKLTRTIQSELDNIKANFQDEIDNLTQRIVSLENVPPPAQTFAKAATPQSDTPRNIVLRNVPESAGGNVIDKVKAVITKGCKVRNVNVEKAVRKDSKVKDRPGVIIATLENIEQRSEILKNKNKLKDSTKHKNIYIQADVCYEQRIASQNLGTILKELGKDNVLVKATMWPPEN
jgi:hypothetical protein